MPFFFSFFFIGFSILAGSNTLVNAFKSEVQKLDPTQATNIRVLETSLKEKYGKAPNDIKDELFSIFLEFYEKVKDEKRKQVGIAELGRETTTKIIERLTAPYLWKLEWCEEQSPYFIDRGTYLNSAFGSFVSPTMGEYLKLRQIEQDKDISPGCEGGVDYLISENEYKQRRENLTKFLSKNKTFILAAEVEKFLKVYKKNYSEYRSFYKYEISLTEEVNSPPYAPKTDTK